MLRILAAALLAGPLLFLQNNTTPRPSPTPAPAPPEEGQVPLDQYGGVAKRVSERTGFFDVRKVGNRWVFVTPEGNPFWLRSVYNAAGTSIREDVIASKYGGDTGLWSTQRNRRLLSWGFNALGEYTSARGLPVGIWGGPPNPVKLPFIMIMNPAIDGLFSWRSMGLADPLKDIVKGVPTSVYGGSDWRAPLIDPYDPAFAQIAAADVNYWMGAFTGGFADKPWIVGITLDDADHLFSIKSRAGAPVSAYPDTAWFVAVTKPSVTSAERYGGGSWVGDTRLYAKHAWIDYLKQRYGSDIQALNRAWNTGGFYRSFDSAGGYGVGTGVMDEDGRHTAWMGTMKYPYTDPGHSPGVKADLDAFRYRFWRQYAEVSVRAIRAVDRNHLIFGPASINNYGAKARDEVLRALADGGVDVFCYSYNPLAPDMSENNLSYDLTGKPAIMWHSVTANADSGMWSKKPIYAAPDFSTQRQRGEHYANVDLPNFWRAKGRNGDFYVLGVNWWELVDNPSEGMNWGLISLRDNAYDGREATTASGTDPWGYRTGGEERSYGDFLSPVRRVNHMINPELFELAK